MIGNHFLKILKIYSFRDLVSRVRISERKKLTMLSAFKIPKKHSVSASIFKPVLPLLPESSINVSDKEKSDYITMELSSGADETGKYKKHLAHFDEGSPQ